MYTLTKQGHWLEETQYETVVYLYYDYLQKFIINKVYTRQQGGQYIQNILINYKIYCRPGKTNAKADILSRDSRYRLQNHNLKIDLKDIKYLILKLSEEYSNNKEKS